ncbi:hypothetical protein N5923_12280 [Erwiniaceae bacterium BAC15a-03b]|uniref:Uncharacterized protein n=1 Tax=Winslowiella arboricola TaxID=2978220 RepID=A0A9J6PRI9_9GAMM|nr:hypothetical protein [Winslowiella arboricola]MCU5772719.1 hypothetical protein [Winslowiella arboricola]MCU5778269.1 hypothetical protein [Winslowiella arboricola]
MKLPRYLQLALGVTGALVLWSQFSEPYETPVQQDLLPQQQPAASITSHNTDSLVTAAFGHSESNLFPFQGPQVAPSPPPPPPKPAAAPKAPSLPFKLVGAWWNHNQRYLVLSDGKQSWIVCNQCRIADSIRSGEKLNENWQLKAIEPDHLVFRWLPLENDQRLSLGDMTSKPKF